MEKKFLYPPKGCQKTICGSSKGRPLILLVARTGAGRKRKASRSATREEREKENHLLTKKRRPPPKGIYRIYLEGKAYYKLGDQGMGNRKDIKNQTMWLRYTPAMPD